MPHLWIRVPPFHRNGLVVGYTTTSPLWRYWCEAPIKLFQHRTSPRSWISIEVLCWSTETVSRSLLWNTVHIYFWAIRKRSSMKCSKLPARRANLILTRRLRLVVGWTSTKGTVWWNITILRSLVYSDESPNKSVLPFVSNRIRRRSSPSQTPRTRVRLYTDENHAYNHIVNTGWALHNQALEKRVDTRRRWERNPGSPLQHHRSNIDRI